MGHGINVVVVAVYQSNYMENKMALDLIFRIFRSSTKGTD